MFWITIEAKDLLGSWDFRGKSFFFSVKYWLCVGRWWLGKWHLLPGTTKAWWQVGSPLILRLPQLAKIPLLYLVPVSIISLSSPICDRGQIERRKNCSFHSSVGVTSKGGPWERWHYQPRRLEIARNALEAFQFSGSPFSSLLSDLSLTMFCYQPTFISFGEV